MFRRRGFDGIYFDLGNVLFPTEPNKRRVAEYWAKFSKLDKIDLEDILCHGVIMQDRENQKVLEFWRWVDQFDNGDFSSYDMYCVMRNLLKMNIDFHDFVRGWEMMIMDPDVEFISFLYELQHLRLGIISNLCEIHLQNIRIKGYLPRDILCSCLYSCVEGRSKPDIIIFLRGIKGMCLPPERILFVDDLKQNIEAAESAGMHGYHWNIQDGSSQKQRLERFKKYLRFVKVL